VAPSLRLNPKLGLRTPDVNACKARRSPIRLALLIFIAASAVRFVWDFLPKTTGQAKNPTNAAHAAGIVRSPSGSFCPLLKVAEMAGRGPLLKVAEMAGRGPFTQSSGNGGKGALTHSYGMSNRESLRNMRL
jgi:hypothetical protein